MRIKKGDNVKITAGKDRGKTGKVIQAFPKLDKVVVEGANAMTKHMKTRKQGEKGQKIEYNAPLNATNVQLVCSKCNKVTRIGTKVLTDSKNKRVRICVKCNEAID
jgi:large subunit ribosomal protein L24